MGNLLEDSLWDEFAVEWADAGGWLFLAARQLDGSRAREVRLQGRALTLHAVTRAYLPLLGESLRYPVGSEATCETLVERLQHAMLLAALLFAEARVGRADNVREMTVQLREVAQALRQSWPLPVEASPPA